MIKEPCSPPRAPAHRPAVRPRSGVAGLALAALVATLGAVLLDPLPASAAACAQGIPSDFNGDGYSDAVVADPYATVAGVAQAGRVVVLYGDADGRVGEGARSTVRQGAGAADLPETGDRFGFSIASADVDGDGCHDLLVGTPLEDVGTRVDSGLAQIVWGAPGGLGTGASSRQLTQLTFGESIRPGDQLGYAVDLMDDVTQGGTPDPDSYALAVGAPGFDVAGRNDAGWVGVFAATDGGAIAMTATQDTPGIPGGAEAGDRFGSSVALGYLTGSAGTVDAAVGVPGEDIGTLVDAGSVTILTDLYDEITSGVGFDQNSPGVAGGAEKGDRFGASVDTVRSGSTSYLAAGVPGEDVGAATDAGQVQLFRSNRVTTTPVAGLTQDSAGVSGAAESGDAFGDDIAFIGAGAGNSQVRLAISAPTEDGSASNSGGVWVFPVTDLDGETVYTQDSAGMPGGVDAGDRFGASLGSARGTTETVLLIGVPDDVDHATGMVNVVPMAGVVRRAWVPGAGGVPGAANRFGHAVAGSVD